MKTSCPQLCVTQHINVDMNNIWWHIAVPYKIIVNTIILNKDQKLTVTEREKDGRQEE